MPDFDRSLFKQAFIEAGLWIPIRATSPASPPFIIDTHAKYTRPDRILNERGQQSTDHEIKYQASDLPDLAEGHLIALLDDDGDPIAGKSFRVREPPYVTDDPSNDTSGYFMRAMLTRIADVVVTETFYELLESGDFALLESGDHELTEASA